MKMLSQERHAIPAVCLERMRFEGDNGKFHTVSARSRIGKKQQVKYYEVDHRVQVAPYQELWTSIVLRLDRWPTIRQISAYYDEGLLPPTHSVVILKQINSLEQLEQDEQQVMDILKKTRTTPAIDYQRENLDESQFKYVAYFGQKHKQSPVDTFGSWDSFSEWFHELWLQNAKRLKEVEADEFLQLEPFPTAQVIEFLALIRPLFSESYEELFSYLTHYRLMNNYHREVYFLMMIFNEIPVDYAMQTYLSVQDLRY